MVPSNGSVYRALSALGAVSCVTSCPHKLAVCQPLLALCCKQSSLNPEGFHTVPGPSVTAGGVAPGPELGS